MERQRRNNEKSTAPIPPSPPFNVYASLIVLAPLIEEKWDVSLLAWAFLRAPSTG